jgi:hypothetical protein
MKQVITRACGHQEKIKIYSGTVKSELVVAREQMKNCRACPPKTKIK